MLEMKRAGTENVPNVQKKLEEHSYLCIMAEARLSARRQRTLRVT